MGHLKEALLQHYGLNEASYASFCLPPDIRNIPFLESDLSVKVAKERILKAIEDKEKILIYGDYDCDGIMATSIMVYSFAKLGYKVASYIPSRYLDGYGLTMDNAKKIVEAGYKLVILVDNGVSLEKEVGYLLSNDVETIIIDHHELPPSLPPSLAFIHPSTLHYGEVPVSAGYLSFLFSYSLLGEIDPYLLILGALSTISDMMPIRLYNREIVRLALQYLSLHIYPTISNLTTRQYIDEDTLSMEIIPKINAVGRVVEDHTVNRVVSYFAYPTSDKVDALARWLDENNEQRKAQSTSALEQTKVDDSKPGIFVLTNLKEGLNGLLANRLLQAYGKPVMVLSPSSSDPSSYVGSLRSKEGFLFPEFAESVSKLLLRYGGHGLAGGLAVRKEDLAKLEEAFYEYASSHPLVTVIEEEIPLALSEVNPESYALISSFGPFGFDWKKPEFALEGIDPGVLRFSKDGAHISTLLPRECKLLGFHIGQEEANKYSLATLHGHFALGEWKGKRNIEFRVKSIDGNFVKEG